jgi:hypothetical protein
VAIYDIAKPLMQSNSDKVAMFVSGAMVHCFDEDAVLLNRLLSHRLSLLGKQSKYLKTAFRREAMNKVIGQIKERLKLSVIVFEKSKDSDDLALFRQFAYKSPYRKADFATANDVQSTIHEIENYNEQQEVITINQVRRRGERGFQLHAKTTRLFRWISLSVSRYLPNIYRQSMGSGFVNEWQNAVRQINHLRNIPDHVKTDMMTLVRHRAEILKRVSVHIDTMKDFAEAIFQVKGFKNRRQYRYILLRLSEIGRIASGLQFANSQKATAA